MLRKSNDIIEDAFKKKMMEGNVPPPPNAWGKLEANLGGTTPPVNYWKWWAIAATILLFVGNGAIYYALNDKIGDLEQVVEHQEHYVQHLAYFQNKGHVKQNQWRETVNHQNQQLASLEKQMEGLKNQSFQENAKNDDFFKMLHQQQLNEMAVIKNQNQQLIQQNAQLLAENQEYKEVVLNTLNSTIGANKGGADTIVIIQKDSVLITQNLDDKIEEEKKEEKESKLKWGIYTGANLIYRNITANKIGATEVTGIRLNHNIKNRIGGIGGVKFMYPINKKIEFVGGVGVDILQEKYDLERTLTTEQTIESTNVTENSYQFDIGTTETKEYETVHNIWTYLDINVGLNYHLIPDKWNLYFGLGVQRVLPFLSNNETILTAYNSSCTLAFEKKYNLSKEHNIGVSPYLTYYLSNAYNEHQALNVKPYMLGIQLNFQKK